MTDGNDTLGTAHPLYGNYRWLIDHYSFATNHYQGVRGSQINGDVW
jgi:hypothetical protein